MPWSNLRQSDASPGTGAGALYEGGMAWLQVGYTYEGEMDVCALAVYQVPDTDVSVGADSIDDFTFLHALHSCTRPPPTPSWATRARATRPRTSRA